METRFLDCNGDAVGRLEVKVKLFGICRQSPPPVIPLAQAMRILDELASQCIVPVMFSSSASPGTKDSM